MPVRLAGGPLVDLELLVSLVMAGMRELSGVSLTRALIPFPGALPSGPDSFPKAPPYIIPFWWGWGVWISTHKWEWGTNLQAVRFPGQPANLTVTQPLSPRNRMKRELDLGSENMGLDSDPDTSWPQRQLRLCASVSENCPILPPSSCGAVRS